jgi:hypothetical protein
LPVGLHANASRLPAADDAAIVIWMFRRVTLGLNWLRVLVARGMLMRTLAIAFAATLLLAAPGSGEAIERPAMRVTDAGTSGFESVAYYRKRRPLEVKIYGRRRVGGYSYSAPDVVNTYGRSPPPWLDVRQSPGGPFDSGFFFDSGIGPRGGNSPYLH